MKIWLDDIRTPPDKTWTWVKRAVVAKMLIASGKVFEISLDNDLGRAMEEGYMVLEWLEQALNNAFGPHGSRIRVPKIYVHTSNPVAAKRMRVVAERIEKLRPKTMLEDIINS